ncbi:MAG: LysR substrate-binding domain-containing protein [Rhodocyclaceae bacterium]|nr:LysR substrate-binding domain-containing protein [Pseudomonadota bacterium]MDQ7974338.1 LysR substrate-binding domain-containing protein [Rhodocyclaceae bacterium]MDQ7998522.1 LysR substrate-binding domain-containing protein [Pseudomonadota bacterium]
MDTTTARLVRKLRLRHLELLAVLAEADTMRSASAQLHLSQPAISKMLGEIEACFGARLFERSHQGIHPNALGAGAVFHARAVLNQLARATEDVGAMQQGAQAVLRVGAPSVTATVPAAIVRLRARMPGAAVQIREGRVQELIQRLLAGELDCVYGAVTPELLTADITPLLEPVAMLQDELCVLASAPPEAAGKPARRLRWRDLGASPWLLPPRDTLVRQAFMTAFLNDGATPPVPVIEAISSVTIGALMRQDASLLCAVRLEHAMDEIARGGVRRLAIAPRVPLPSFGLFFRRDGMERPAVLLAFAEAVKAAAARLSVPRRRG